MSVTVHDRHLRFLAVELFKVIPNPANPVMFNIFPLRSSTCKLRSQAVLHMATLVCVQMIAMNIKNLICKRVSRTCNSKLRTLDLSWNTINEIFLIGVQLSFNIRSEMQSGSLALFGSKDWITFSISFW